MKKVLVSMFLLVFGLCLVGCENIGNSETYKLTIQNDSSNELIGIKNEYKAGEEVEVKMEYDMAVETYVFLNGELLGTLNGSNSLKFNMPEKDSTLVVTYTNGKIFKLNVIDNFDLIEEELNEYYAPEEIIIFHISHELYDNITVTINGEVEEGIDPLIGTNNFKTYLVRMSEGECEIKVTVNGLSDYSCNDNLHHYEEEIKKVDNSYIKESTCKLCGEIVQEEITKIKLDTTILYFGSYSDYSFELFVKEYNLSNRKYLIIDNVESYYEIYPNIPRMNKELLSEEEADEFFKDNIMVLHIRYISGTLDFVPVNYYYNTIVNNIIMEYTNDVSGDYVTQFLGNTLDIITIPKEYYNKINK